MNKQRIILIVGIALAVIAVIMIKVYLDQQRQLIAQNARQAIETMKANQSAVLVSKQDIPKGAAISGEALEVNIIPNKYVQPQAVTSLDRISGMVAIAPISKGEQVTLNKLAYMRQGAAGALADVTPIGKRAITIFVDNISSLVGMVKSGDNVDVIAMLNVPTVNAEGRQTTQTEVIPLFQNVLVLAVGQEIGSPAEGRYRKEDTTAKKEQNPLITVALTPQEANLIAFVQDQGKVRLVLRSPSDSKIEPMQPANWDTLFQYIKPKKQGGLEDAKKDEAAPEGYVEIYRGMKKERVPLSPSH